LNRSLYAESSAILAYLLGEPGGEAVANLLATARRVIISELTLAEVDRTLLRAHHGGQLVASDLAEVRVHLAEISARWFLQRMAPEIFERARRPFPIEPIRTLDALHLAGALEALNAAPSLALLSLDRRVRENAQELGLPLLPA
jgi:PIN domain